MKGVEEGTENMGGIRVTSIGKGRSQLIVRGRGGKEDPADRAFAIRVVEDICNELRVEYKLVEG